MEIIESRRPAWSAEEAWVVEQEPNLEIGSQDGAPEYIFFRVAGALRLDDRRIVIADGFSNQVRFYSEAGEFLKAVGREGQGPGEYQYIRGLGRCGADSVFAFDINWQAKVYTADGALVREMAIHDPQSYQGLSPYNLSCSRSGYFLITGWGEQTLQQIIGFYQATAPVSLLDRDGDLVVDLGERLASERVGRETGSRPHPFGRSTELALADDRIFVGGAGQLEVQAFSMGGTLTAILRGPPLDLTIRGEDIDRYREERLARFDEPDRATEERRLRDMPMPEQFPAYTDLRVDPEGNLWVQRFLRPGDDRNLWTVFAADGAMLGDIEIPTDLEITEIGADYVLGVSTDEMDVERVRLHRLLKR
jgi:hypothetical protein